MRETPSTDEKGDRGGNAENGSTNLFKWVEDQTIRTQVCPAAKCGPCQRANVLPRWHLDKDTVDATARQAIKGCCQKEATKQKETGSRRYQVFLASLIRITHLVFPFLWIAIEQPRSDSCSGGLYSTDEMCLPS
jgi:hypothetical protein